ncbi:pyridoxal phosphate-dependent transferase, partial [Kalaharituber pfeilii]
MPKRPNPYACTLDSPRPLPPRTESAIIPLRPPSPEYVYHAYPYGYQYYGGEEDGGDEGNRVGEGVYADGRGKLRPPVDLSHHFSQTARRRLPSMIKTMYRYFSMPGMKNLMAGMPPPDFFPYDTLESLAALPNRFHKSANTNTSPLPGTPGVLPAIIKSFFPTHPTTSALPTAHITVPKYPSGNSPPPADPFGNFPITLSTALQYGTAQGYPPLLNFVKDFSLHHVHAPHGGIPYASPAFVLSNGNTDGINKVFEMLLGEWDALLVEKYTYSPAVAAAIPRGACAVGVEMDEEGISVDGPGGLIDVLQKWEVSRWGKMGWRRPGVLYTIAVGQNPTGRVAGRERKRRVYEVCERFDVIIVEDEPYWHLYYPEGEDKGHGDFLASLPPSYLTFDVSGRVIRLDTFSKTIAPGCRLGWITAQPAMVQKLLLVNEASTQQASGFSQAMVAELLVNRWGVGGFVEWIGNLRERYAEKMRIMCDALEDGAVYLSESEAHGGDSEVVVSGTRMIEFLRPRGGMFVWLRVLLANHPLYKRPFSREYLAGKVWVYLADPAYGHKILVGPGRLFMVNGYEDDEEGGSGGEGKRELGEEYVRLSFTVMRREELRTATRGFVEGLRGFWGLGREEMERVGMGDG